MGPVRLQVADLERSLEYYQRVLGFRLSRGEGGAASLAADDDDRTLVELRERAGAAPVPLRGHLGLYHFALLLPTRADLGRLLRHLHGQGERPGAADHLVSEALYLRDPDGMGIEVYADRPRAAWQSEGGELRMGTAPMNAREVLREAGDGPWSGVPIGSVVGHVHLHVGDLERAERFYHAALGLDKVVWSYPGALFLSAGGYHHHLGLNVWAPEAAPAGEADAKLLEWTIELAGAGDVAAAARNLAAFGYPAEPAGTGEIVTRDPWGTQLRVGVSTDRTMAAIRVHHPGGAESLRVERVPIPEPAAGEALVRLDFAGVNFIEVYQRSGLYPVPLPFTLGGEGAGEVVAIGSGSGAVRVGDRVAWAGGFGAYAEYAVVSAEKLVPLPSGISVRVGAAVMLQGMTAHYLATSTYALRPGERCLIHAAAGGVGLLLVQIAKRCGAYVIATVGSDEKAELAAAAGADEVIVYTRQDFAAEVRRSTQGQGVHVVYDSVGKTTFHAGLDLLRPRGTMVLFGQSSGPVEPIDPQLLNQKGSLFLTRPSLGHYVATREELLGRARDLFEWIEAGEITLHVGAEFALEGAAEAHRALEGRATTGKVLLRAGRAAE